MKHIYIIFITAFALSLSSCSDMLQLHPGWAGEILSMQLGYMSEVEGSGRDFEHSEIFDGKAFIGFIDSESYKAAQKEKEKEDMYDDFTLPPNRFEYTKDETTFVVNVYPKLCEVRNVLVESSDPSILEIISIEGTNVKVRTHQVGDVNIKVHVTGSVNDMSAEYPVRIVYPIDMNFYITPYWSASFFDNIRIRYKVCSMPPGVKELVTEIRDSVTIVSYCRYYNHNLSQYPFIDRDTLKLSAETFVDRFRKSHRITLRNLTGQFRNIRKTYVEGTKKQTNDDGEEEIVPHKYYYSVETVILDMNVVSDNPYVEFRVHSKDDKVFDHYDETTGGYIDTGTDEPEYDGDMEDGHLLTEYEAKYFLVQINAFVSDEEMAKMMGDLKRELDEVGFDAELSDEDKDRQLDEINKHKKEGDDDD